MSDEFREFPTEDDICDGCGEFDGCCPLCCGNIYSPGSEECDWCEYSDNCGGA